jgi:hypothetical protein
MSSPIRRLEDDDPPLDQAPSWLFVRRGIAEPGQGPDAAEPQFSGDRALLKLNRQLSLSPDGAPEPPFDAYDKDAQTLMPLLWRFLLVAGVAAIIAWYIVLLPSLKKVATVTTQIDSPQRLTEAKQVKQADERPVTAPPAMRQSLVSTANPPRLAAAGAMSTPAAATVSPVADAARPTDATILPVPMIKSVLPPTPPASKSSTGADLASSVRAFAPAPPSVPLAPADNPVTTSARPSAQLRPASLPIPSVTRAPSTKPPLTSVTDSGAPQLASAEITMLVDRGKDFLAAGDLSSAQLLFRRAAEAGSAEAALALASTYDPHYLAEHNVVGVAGDEVKARTWYQRAMELGSPEAAHMLAQLSIK